MIQTLASMALDAGTDLLTQHPNAFALSKAPDDDFWYQAAGASTGAYTGKAVTEETAMRASAFYAGVRVIAETVAGLPKFVFERLPNGGKQTAYDHPLYSLIHDTPNEELTSFEFFELGVARCLTWGNFVAKLELDTKGNVGAMIPVDPALVDIERDRETGVRFYRYRPNDGSEPKIWMEDEVLHIPGLLWNGTKGHSPIALMREPIALFLAVEEYQARFFGNNAIAGMYISHPQSLSDKAKKNLLESWNALHQGLRGAHKAAVLDEGMKVETVPVEFAKQQFAELRQFQVEEIARILRVPLHLIQSLARATNNNIEHQSIDFATHTILPWVKRIEQRLNRALFGPRERARYFIEFSMDGLLRGDSASRATYYTQLRNAGIITANEIRARENMNPIEGGDVLLVQGAMIPVDQAGQKQEAAAA